jgi:hypothetical protein
MGVLDDAIREHLELKRKHGAAQDEVEQQEQEALGAPRREPAELGQAAPEPAGQAPEPEVEVADPAPEGDEEDVLEETPDFLQETPEHDRLWFEQKPPRDFDFDESP